MTWSLFNEELEPAVNALLDSVSREAEDDFKPAMSREKCEGVIHAALWAYVSRAGSTASGYALSNLFDLLGLSPLPAPVQEG